VCACARVYACACARVCARGVERGHACAHRQKVSFLCLGTHSEKVSFCLGAHRELSGMGPMHHDKGACVGDSAVGYKTTSRARCSCRVAHSPSAPPTPKTLPACPTGPWYSVCLCACLVFSSVGVAEERAVFVPRGVCIDSMIDVCAWGCRCRPKRARGSCIKKLYRGAMRWLRRSLATRSSRPCITTRTWTTASRHVRQHTHTERERDAQAFEYRNTYIHIHSSSQHRHGRT
jgi:hypothetical protein